MRLHTIARLGARERQVVGLLRGAGQGEVSCAFAALHDVARTMGCEPAAAGSDVVTNCELCLIGVIAGLQRAAPQMTMRLPPPLRAGALACARALSDHGIMLDHSTFARLTGMPEPCAAMSIELVLAAEALRMRALVRRGPLTSARKDRYRAGSETLGG